MELPKCNSFFGSIKSLSLILLRTCFLTIYKALFRSHLYYTDIIYDKPDNESLKYLLKKIQYNAPLAITGRVRVTSRESIYNELDPESLADIRLYGKMISFYKIVKNLAPKYLQSYLLPEALNQYLQKHCHLATRSSVTALTNGTS